MLVWDNLNVHRSAAMQAFIDGTDWLTVVYLPSYAPDLNPVEGVWSVVKRGGYANQAFTGIDQMARVVGASLRRVQNLPHVLEGVLAHIGLALTEITDNTQ
ncbi:transposase [Nocardiopsis aegyptia]|uniref:Transposase n=1 Tax=Nocardiopsis aegyptia TaxID=220378 RepID=A0A7Z0J8V4_9ACTN|nr:transposase [Nocardiopsis aegyptia]NYJ32824.1 transposase [Nocardiopsis aegyptia]